MIHNKPPAHILLPGAEVAALSGVDEAGECGCRCCLATGGGFEWRRPEWKMPVRWTVARDTSGALARACGARREGVERVEVGVEKQYESRQVKQRCKSWELENKNIFFKSRKLTHLHPRNLVRRMRAAEKREKASMRRMHASKERKLVVKNNIFPDARDTQLYAVSARSVGVF